MKIENIQEELNKKIEVRNNLIIIKEEMKKLEELDSVKKYLKLQSYYENNKEFDNKEDDEILSMLIDKKKLDLELENCFYCYGKNYKAGLRKNGEYYILPKDTVQKRFNSPIDVGIYRSFEDPNKTVIIPQKEIKEFEDNHPIIRASEENKDGEYNKLRRIVVKDKLGIMNKKELVKK